MYIEESARNKYLILILKSYKLKNNFITPHTGESILKKLNFRIDIGTYLERLASFLSAEIKSGLKIRAGNYMKKQKNVNYT